jgi:hypothetical protein
LETTHFRAKILTREEELDGVDEGRDIEMDRARDGGGIWEGIERG